MKERNVFFILFKVENSKFNLFSLFSVCLSFSVDDKQISGMQGDAQP